MHKCKATALGSCAQNAPIDESFCYYHKKMQLGILRPLHPTELGGRTVSAQS